MKLATKFWGFSGAHWNDRHHTRMSWVNIRQMRTIKSCFVGLSHITQRSLQGQKLLLRNYFLLSVHCESCLFEYLYSAGSRTIRQACSCYLLSLRRGVLMGTFTVKRWDMGGGVRTIWWRDRWLHQPHLLRICVLRILRDSFVLTRTVESYLPSKSLE